MESRPQYVLDTGIIQPHENTIPEWCTLTRKIVVHFNPQNDTREKAGDNPIHRTTQAQTKDSCFSRGDRNCVEFWAAHPPERPVAGVFAG
jgi:hypothetical protein